MVAVARTRLGKIERQEKARCPAVAGFFLLVRLTHKDYLREHLQDDECCHRECGEG